MSTRSWSIERAAALAAPLLLLAACRQGVPELPACATLCTLEPEAAALLVLDGERAAVGAVRGSVEPAESLEAALAILRERRVQESEERGFPQPLLYVLCGRDTPASRVVEAARTLPEIRAVSFGGGEGGRVAFASFSLEAPGGAGGPRLRRDAGGFSTHEGRSGADPVALLGGACAPSIQAPCPIVTLEAASFTCGQLIEAAEALHAAGLQARVG